MMQGYPGDIDHKAMVGFLNTLHGFRWQKIKFEPQITYLTVDQQDADVLLSKNGILFEGNPVSIEVSVSASEAGGKGGHYDYGRPQRLSDQNRHHLTELLGQRATPTRLNLAHIVTAMAIPAASFSNYHFVNDLLQIIKVNCPQIEAIDFSGNEIVTLKEFRNFHRSAPKLSKLCFANNKIESLDELHFLKDMSLEELILSPNPVMSTIPEMLYRHKICKRFPKLNLLDMKVPTPIIEFKVAKQTGIPTTGSFYDSARDYELAKRFVEMYFSVYDSNREMLLNAYAPTAIFSQDASIAHSTGAAPLPNVYATSSHNLLNKSDLSSNVACKPFNVVHALLKLPKTTHNIPEMVADVFVPPTRNSEVLCIAIRGTFLEIDSQKLRLFHRVFLLVPPASASDQWPALIINDQLHVSELDQKRLESTRQDGSLGIKPGQVVVARSPQLAPRTGDEALIQQLVASTGCPPDMAIQALQHTHGNVEAAISAINEHQLKTKQIT